MYTKMYTFFLSKFYKKPIIPRGPPVRASRNPKGPRTPVWETLAYDIVHSSASWRVLGGPDFFHLTFLHSTNLHGMLTLVCSGQFAPTGPRAETLLKSSQIIFIRDTHSEYQFNSNVILSIHKIGYRTN